MEEKKKEEKEQISKGRYPKKKLLAAALIAAAVVVTAAGSLICVYHTEKENGQQAAAMQKGQQGTREQKTGTVTAEGSISVGTISQTFEMDLSEFTGGTGSSFSFGDGMMFPQMNMGGGTGNSGTDSADSRNLTVEEIYVKVGEEVSEGTPILKVTENTLTQIRTSLEEDAADAKTVYNQLLTQEELTLKEAQAQQKENQLYGTYADTEYNLAVQELQDAVTELTQKQEEAQEKITEAQEELAELQESLAAQQKVLENAVYIVEYEDRLTNTYSWLSGVNAREDAETVISNLETQIENTQEEILSQEEEMASLSTQLVSAQKALEIGIVEAESTRTKRQLEYESAQEIYDVTTQLAEFEAEAAKEEYELAAEKLTQLDSYLAEGVLCADGSGVVTEISVSVGDSLSEGTQLLSRNSYEDVTITVTLEEDDMETAALNSRAEVYVSAFPDETLEGKVTEIGDAQIDSDTNKTTYQVTVTILENGAKLYEGMTAEVTFLGEEEAQQ